MKRISYNVLFQVEEGGCIIRGLEYQADEEKGFQVILVQHWIGVDIIRYLLILNMKYVYIFEEQKINFG